MKDYGLKDTNYFQLERHHVSLLHYFMFSFHVFHIPHSVVEHLINILRSLFSSTCW